MMIRNLHTIVDGEGPIYLLVVLHAGKSIYTPQYMAIRERKLSPPGEVGGWVVFIDLTYFRFEVAQCEEGSKWIGRKLMRKISHRHCGDQ